MHTITDANFKVSKHEYLPGVDGLRAIAVIAVLIYHLDLFKIIPGGFTGVDVFFVISGYVISKSLFKEHSSNIIDYLLRFYKKRALRILPALLFCLLITTILSTLFIPNAWLSDTNSKTGFFSFFGLSNFALVWYADGYFAPRSDFNPFTHTWSLAVEEQFYLIFPVLFFIWAKFRNKKSIWGYFSFSLLPILVLLSFGYSYFETSLNYQKAFYLLPSRFWELALGGILFRLHVSKFCLPASKNSSVIYFLCGFSLLLTGFLCSTEAMFPFPWAIVPVLGALLLISAVASRLTISPVFKNFLESKYIVYVGKISYSLYLWHWPVYTLLRWTVGFDYLGHKLLAVLLSLVFSMISYHFVEYPLRTNSFVKRQQSRLIVIIACISVLISANLGKGIHNAKPKINLSVTKDTYNWYPYAKPPSNKDNVIENTRFKGRNLFVVGDSHTGAYTAMLDRVSSKLGIRTHQFFTGGGNIVKLIAPMNGQTDNINLLNQVVEKIKSICQPNDIVFFASLRMNRLIDQWAKFDEATVINNQKESIRNRKLAVEQAERLIKQFNKLGLHVLIDAPKPIFKAPPFRCSDWFNKTNPICSPGFTISQDFLLQHRQPAMDAINELKDRCPYLYVWDPFFVLCPDQNCHAFDGANPLFFDGDHLSGYGNKVLAPWFADKIIAIWDENI